MKGLITFEGIDGCGKTTQIELLSAYFTKNNIKNIIIREPGGTSLSESIRNILLDKNKKISSESETLLFLSARAQLVNEIIVPNLNKNKVVLCDRYIDSTLAYQGYGRELDKKIINQLNEFATNTLIPDLTFIFDVDPLEAKNRLKDKDNDRMESLDLDFYNKVRNGYLEIAKFNQQRCNLINCSNKTIMDIHLKLVEIIKILFKGKQL